VTKFLAEQGADVKASKNDGWTPLHKAGENGHAEATKFLAEQGADVKASNNDGWTPLHGAAWKLSLRDLRKEDFNEAEHLGPSDSTGKSMEEKSQSVLLNESKRLSQKRTFRQLQRENMSIRGLSLESK
jgi:hypothetical protein